MKINPALLKLELFCKGIKVDTSCDLEKDARPILRTRGGLGSGLEVILPGNIYVNIPIEEDFVKQTPYVLFKKNNNYYIAKEGKIECPIKLPIKPKFYNKKTSSGKTMSRIGVLQGTYLGVYPTGICKFWQMNPMMNCKFCSVGLNIGKTEEYDKTVNDVLETVKAAKNELKITFVHFNTGYLFGEELDILEPYIITVKKMTGLLIGVQCPPNPDLSKYNHLKKIGVDHMSFCLEIYDAARYKEICPGKHKYISQEKYLDVIRYCTKIFGKGRVAGEIIVGLEAPSSTITAIETFAKLGAVTTVCVFRPSVGTELENLAPPQVEKVLHVFKRLYEVCLEYNIPFAIAPNIKVSLVLLPEECGYLVKKNIRSYFVRIKLGLLKIIFMFYFIAQTTKATIVTCFDPLAEIPGLKPGDE